MIRLNNLAALLVITAIPWFASAESTEKLGPRGLCVECSIESRGPAANAQEIFFRSLPPLSEIKRECPKAKRESTLLISQFDQRRSAQMRQQLSFVFGENSPAAEVVTLYGSYFSFDNNPEEPTLLLNFFAFRTANQARQIGSALAKNPHVRVVMSDRFIYLLLPTTPPDEGCRRFLEQSLERKLEETTKSLASSPLAASLKDILFAEGTILDATEPLTEAQLKDLAPHHTSIFSAALAQSPMGAGFEVLKEFPNLQVLSVGPTRLSSADVQSISVLSGLRQLRAGGCGLSDAGLASLSNLSLLEELSLRDNPLTDKSAKSIAKLSKLVSLGIARTQFGDDGMKELSALPALESLFLARTQVGDAGVASFVGHKKLRLLMLHGTKITDGVVNSLLAIPALQQVGLSETAVSQSAIEKLEKARPQLRIY